MNKRTDKYGGESLDNQSRIVLEIIDMIKAEVDEEGCVFSSSYASACHLSYNQLCQFLKGIPTLLRLLLQL